MQLAEGRAEPDSAIPFDRARRLGAALMETRNLGQEFCAAK